MKRLYWIVLCCFSVCVSAEQVLSERGAQQAENNFLLFCQGCHGPKGVGRPGNVPRVKDFIGNFLQVNGGREFLVQVPGSAYSVLDDKQLAQLLNWMVLELSPQQVPENFISYSANEVGQLRKNALTEVDSLRAKLIKIMQSKGIDVAENADS